MTTKLLINPANQHIAARLEGELKSKKLTIQDERIMRILNGCGINVSRDFMPDRSYHIFPDHPDHSLFVEAFEKYFYPHGLMQKGFYWIKEEDYKKELSSYGSSQDIATEIIRKHIASF